MRAAVKANPLTILSKDIGSSLCRPASYEPFPPAKVGQKHLAVTHGHFHDAQPVSPRPGNAKSPRNHLVREHAATIDLDAHFIAGLEELAARHADAGGRAGGDHIARLQCDVAREISDLLHHIVHEPAGVGILLEHTVD